MHKGRTRIVSADVGGVLYRVPPEWVGLPAREEACSRRISELAGHFPPFVNDLQPPTSVPLFPRFRDEDQPYLLS